MYILALNKMTQIKIMHKLFTTVYILNILHEFVQSRITPYYTNEERYLNASVESSLIIKL